MKKHQFLIFMVIILILPWIIGVLINVIPNLGATGSQSDWLSFWGSYSGSIIAFGGIYWQVNKQHEQSREELLKHEELERALTIENSRPHLTMARKYFYAKITKDQLFENMVLAKKSVKDKVLEQIERQEPYYLIHVKNDSENVAYHCSLLVEGVLMDKNNMMVGEFKELEKIGTLGPKEEIHILPNFLEKNINLKPEYLSTTFKFTSSKNEIGYYFQDDDMHQFVKDRGSVQAYGSDRMVTREETRDFEINTFKEKQN